MAIITISRTFGSEGEAIGRSLAAALEYRYFNRQELEEKARGRKYLRADVEVMDERGLPIFDVLFRDKPKEYLAFLHDTICDVAEQDDVVIVGRGGQAILRYLPTAFHVRVDAPLEMRVQRVMDRLGEAEPRARRRVKDVDKERDSFVRQAFGVDPSDILQYHLVINTGKMDVPTSVRVIRQSFEQIPWKEKQDEARGMLNRYRMGKAIRTELIRHPNIFCPSSVNIRCDDRGVVTLTGWLTEPNQKLLIETVVRSVRGVSRVINQLTP